MNMKQKIEDTRGKFFTVRFIKKDGSVRKMLARTGVKKGLVGVGRIKPIAENLVCVYDVVNKGYRTINCDSVLDFKCGDKV